MSVCHSEGPLSATEGTYIHAHIQTLCIHTHTYIDILAQMYTQHISSNIHTLTHSHIHKHVYIHTHPSTTTYMSYVHKHKHTSATPYFETYFVHTFTHSHMCTYTRIQTVNKTHIQLMYDNNIKFIHKYCNTILTNLSVNAYTKKSHNYTHTHTHIYLVLFLT
ncbi:Hypothetical predicted protein [Octopus vulgaris]|uniref:Uncharacterized protein n=1 Tax=Octopus vulgaris TaxID=6645 RepID=A0AA36BFQ6_OCTVU|nr:Hypothetical predicted protein [Octopus vulgaris]